MQGQSFFQASGDSGSIGSDPEDIRHADKVTVVGGTILNMDGLGASYNSETGWPSSGGGILFATPIPDYQQGISMTFNGGSTTNRNVPDVAMVAQDVEVVATTPPPGASLPTPGTRVDFEGTSIAAPLWAAFMALANQEAAAIGNLTVGFANPTLYSISKAPALYALDFNDPSSGSNGEFVSVAGYDLVTGLGSPKCNLISTLAATIQMSLAFGGAFQTEDLSPGCGGDSVANGADNSDLNCAPGFQSRQFGRVLTPEDKCGASQFFCISRFGGDSPPAVSFGGMFQVGDNVPQDCGLSLGGCPFALSDDVANAVSGTFGCPTGYHAIPTGRVLTPENNIGAEQFACEGMAGDPILERRWSYGGSFQVDDCGEATILNPLTDTPGCPVGFQPSMSGRARNPEGMQCGVSQFVCVLTVDDTPPVISFGGAFQAEDNSPGCGQDNVPSPVLGGACPGNIPALRFGRILTPEDKCGASQLVCATVGENPSAELFGGMFQVDDGGGGVPNPLTADLSFGCPTGFTQVGTGRVFTPEQQAGASQFACEAPAGTVTADARQFGGVFQIDDCQQHTLPNPIIGRVGCPSGFSSAQFGRAMDPEAPQCGVSEFLCFR